MRKHESSGCILLGANAGNFQCSKNPGPKLKAHLGWYPQQSERGSELIGKIWNVTFTNILVQPSQWGANSTSLTVICIALLMAILSAVFLPSFSDGIFYQLDGFYLVTAWTFFSKRYDFFQERLKKTDMKIFHFRAVQHHIFAMAGEANRKIFYNHRSLDLTQGYRILAGGIPKLKDINLELDQDSYEFIRRLLPLLRKERVDEVIPLFLEDINRRTKDWGTEGKIDPFKEVYTLVFQMTVRLATCGELSENKEAITLLEKLYWDVENSGTPSSILFPWFPSSAKKLKQKATLDLYTMLLSYVSARRKSPTPSMDPIDLYISHGLSDDDIVETIMYIIFAGVINTGINSCWALLHLDINPKWKRKAIDEYKALVDKYTNTSSSDPLHIRLSTVPLEAWENELPSLEGIIRETLRIAGSATVLRRNIGKDLQVGETTIKKGDFVAYSASDANLNPDIYTNPTTFDPDRYGPGREEDRKEALSYLSWGAGRHPCAGMKIAKLEIKLVLAMILLGYEYQLVDSNGNYPNALPDQDRNDLQRSRPSGDPCYLKYKRIVD